MILINGIILESDETGTILSTLEKRVCKTLKKSALDPMIVVEACNKLACKIEQGNYFPLLAQLIKEGNLLKEQLEQVVCLFKKESLLYKMKLELGEDLEAAVLHPPYYKKTPIHKILMPLGVLFHIAAGNVDGLPAYSVVEGLLAGNVNLLKLPQVDHGFTLQLLYELIRQEPLLAEYIYVFDTSSNDIAAMQTMARSADAVVVWGGDTAIEAVRKLAAPNTRIIEWGHKISFAYVTEQGMSDMALAGLAHHILSTKQLLCSSCQGIFIDTADLTVVYSFCDRFLEILERVARDYPKPSIGIQAQITLLLYNQKLEATKIGSRIYKGNHCSIIAKRDQKLETSYTYGNCWVKALSKKHIIERLHRYKGYLQTVGLLCGREERASLSDILFRAGATRITDASEMSRMICGETHDGEYPLRRYTKMVEYNE